MKDRAIAAKNSAAASKKSWVEEVASNGTVALTYACATGNGLEIEIPSSVSSTRPGRPAVDARNPPEIQIASANDTHSESRFGSGCAAEDIEQHVNKLRLVGVDSKVDIRRLVSPSSEIAH